LKVEPAVGIEPTTDGLQNRCSTAELSWPEGLQTVPVSPGFVKTGFTELNASSFGMGCGGDVSIF
jgi:hypothetical protein